MPFVRGISTDEMEKQTLENDETVEWLVKDGQLVIWSSPVAALGCPGALFDGRSA